MKSMLVATTDSSVKASLRSALKRGQRLEEAASGQACLDLMARRRFDLAFVDIAFISEKLTPGAEPDYAAALKPFRSSSSGPPLIVLTPAERIRQTVSAVKAGADNYLTYPVDPHEVELVISGLNTRRQIESELEYLRESFWRGEAQGLVRTRSPLMREVYEKLEMVAPTRATVLLTGETGTGKSLLARLIHMHSSRSGGPFVAVHCGSMPDTLVESELFGHERGAFTGAERRKLGKFQIADQGTIFLDEVGTISPAAQIKLLQVLQEGSFCRVGGEQDISVDVRVVAASNVDLAKKISDGGFRDDLYYRLNVFAIELPPLRARREDLPLLVSTLLERLNRNYSKGITGVDERAMQVLSAYAWPGNIRELENLLERAYILERGRLLSSASFPADLVALEHPGESDESSEGQSLAEVRRRAVEEVERRYLERLLAAKKGRVDQAAAQAGVTTRQLRNLLAKYGMASRNFK
ncbi:MAG: sigma-54 dependent transcriptional regulator [Desulfarculus sp.]|nr:sigma-54 dependent transcriptional regulator [Pseudomonadota bacterium]MBU4576985.1 sigma-54 dependent transcriptional regulator [Pseudomonadota bacterium]MBU4598727.1 sigma-54 dependent transcriptional regulator [Pseudomonadota bacterium]MBV1717430.1 sigma-54 dependent transcriptional regulator [Desulfarculus sp.]MBV1740000.1 sigma-54 dependent transcriptional regulator [Desulfarculus sp.]